MSCNVLCPAITSRIMDGIKELWGSRGLSDVTLKADDKSFPVHRLLLALSSDYFMAMLTSDMLETKSNEIELKGVTARGLEPLLEYIYTGTLPLTKNNVCEVIMAATHLQMETALQYCTDRMNNVIRTENCVDLKNVAKMCSLEDIEFFADDYILDNFASVMKEGSHCRLDLRALLLCYYHERADDTDAVLIGPEKRVFKLLMDWIKHGEDERMADLSRVMDIVRLPLMTLEEIEEVMREVPALGTDPACQRYIEDARDYHRAQPHQRVMMQSKKTRLRNHPLVLSISLDEKNRPQMYALCLQGAFNPHAERSKAKWIHLVEMESQVPDIEFSRDLMTTVVVNDFLILIGVSDNETKPGATPSACYLFDPRFSTWSKLASLNIGRYKPAVLASGGYLYVLGGGLSRTDPTNTDSIERYDFNTNKWEEVGKMTDKLRNHAACVLEDKILITGGRRNNGIIANMVQLFNPKTGVSSSIYPMPTPHECHKMYNIGDTVYVILPEEGVIKTYQDDIQTWKKFWVRLGGPKIPENSQCINVGTNVVFVNGILERDFSDSDDSDDYETEKFAVSEHACVEVVIGDLQQGAGKVFPHEEFPSELGQPVILAGLRLPWHFTHGLFQQ